MSKTADNSVYQNNAASYDAENEGRARTMLRKAACVAPYLKPEGNSPPTILEIGCGTGIFTQLLAERFPQSRITATDAFAPMLELATARLRIFPAVSLAHYDAETAGNFSTRFEIVCGADIIHHLNQPVQAMRHWLKLVRFGGHLVFFESNAYNPVIRLRTLNRPEETRFKYSTRANLIRWADEAGWSDVAAEYIPLYFPSGPQPMWPIIDRLEMATHRLIVVRPVSGGMIVRARAA